MALPPGTRLGPYQVAGPLGAGGMGEVYRAYDTRLDRNVAIKVLPPDVSRDPERRTRFEREARAVAALTNPHICTLFDVGHEGHVEYLVMELIEGTTLAERLEKGPLPLPEALSCAIQVADALAAAHRLGIVHRDLKPANIMLARGGVATQGSPQVKLLDFGLAKLRAERAAVVDGPTAVGLTGQGQIVGTLHYMAPEQLEGRPADARADIFAFGAVVFEMVTGQQAFEGSSPASVIGAILRAPVTPMSQVVPLVPQALDRLVSVCLAKDPADRWSSAHDVLLQLRAIREGPASPLPAAADAVPHARRVITRERVAWAVGLLAVAAASLGAGAWLARRALPSASADPVVDRVSLLAAPATALERGEAPQVSPDGRYVAFVGTDPSGRSLIHLRSRDSLDVHAVPGTEDATLPFWAPDSRRLGFFAGGQLKTVAISGGTPLVLAPATVARGGSWSREDAIIYVGRPVEPPLVVPAAGGEPRPVPMPSQDHGVRWFPVFLPDGRHYLYLGSRSTERVGFAIYLASLDSADTREVVRTTASAGYADPGYLLFRRGTTLMAQRFDTGTLMLTGTASPVADDVGFNAITTQSLFSASADGIVVYQSSAPGSQLVWFDRQGNRIGAAAPPGDYSTLCLTADEERVVYDISDQASGLVDIWTADAAGGSSFRLTFHRAIDFYPVCSPVGREALFASLRGGSPNLFRLAEGSPGSESAVRRSPAPMIPMIPSDWSRDGNLVVYSELGRETNWDVRVAPLSGGDPVTIAGTGAEESSGRLSPDGRWMVYVSNETGSYEVYVQPFPATGARWQISKGGGFQPQWRRDGRELFYLAQDRRLVAVAVNATGMQLAVGEPRVLFQTRVSGRDLFSRHSRQYAVADNGNRFLVSTATDDVRPITMVRNWPALLGR